MSIDPHPFPTYTAEDYAAWKGDWELWDGVPIAMSPSPFGRHQTVVAKIVTHLTLALEASDCHATVVSELDWIVRADTVVRPDVMLICGDPPETHQRATPALVVEVLSPSTQANDRGFKRTLYREQGVATYLIVDPVQETVESIPMDAPDAASTAVSSVQLTVCKDCAIDIDATRFFPKRHGT
ncbi:Uma2 family endonuclease [Rhodopirellula sp. JC639]|uniref:Uma2 family endonuclease n=1 Tax=Stieleria mannarensis TaxID=2755585 RepID=UPI0016022BAF|nr:Uma2 family endonuclease [Rhodopirellula sp. JC639]